MEGVPEIPCDSSSVSGAKCMPSLLIGLVRLEFMGGSDHSSVGSEPAFLKEIMRREAMIGIIITLAL